MEIIQIKQNITMLTFIKKKYIDKKSRYSICFILRCGRWYSSINRMVSYDMVINQMTYPSQMALWKD